MESNVDKLPRKTYMRRQLHIQNPNVIKSSDGNIYKKTGKVIDLDYVKPKGQVYTVPPSTVSTGFDIFTPFRGVMSAAVRKKGFLPPSSIEDLTKLFHNQIVAAKGFAGAKPINYEATDHADPIVKSDVAENVLTYFRSLIAGVQPDGTPLASQDQKLSADVKKVAQDIAGRVAASGMSPQDAAASGATMSNTPPVPEPIWKKPGVKMALIVVAAIVVLKIVF